MHLGFKQSEGTAARRRLAVLLVDATDGYTAETSVTSPTVEISKNGGTQASGGGTWTEIGDGQYYYEFTAAELDTLGWVAISIRKAGCRDFNAACNVLAFDPYDAVRLGLTALPNAAAGASGGLPTGDASGRVTVGGYATGQAPLQPTVAGRTVAVDASGNVPATIGTGAIATGAITASDFDADYTDLVRDAVGLAAADLDTQLAALPTAAENADAVWDEARSGHATAGTFGEGIASVQGSVAGAVGSVTGNVGGSVASVTAGVTLADGAITAAKIATGAIDADALAADAVAEIADGVWDEPLAGHATAGTAGKKLSDLSSGGGGGGTVVHLVRGPLTLRRADGGYSGAITLPTDEPIDLLLDLIDESGKPVSLVGLTPTATCNNEDDGSEAATLTVTVVDEDYGRVQVAGDTAPSTAGRLRLTIQAGTGEPSFGPLRINVEAR